MSKKVLSVQKSHSRISNARLSILALLACLLYCLAFLVLGRYFVTADRSFLLLFGAVAVIALVSVWHVLTFRR